MKNWRGVRAVHVQFSSPKEIRSQPPTSGLNWSRNSQNIAMKAIILCAAVTGVLTLAVNAADIFWGSATTISGASDVNTLGTYFGSWAPYNGSANSTPVN